jgi:hypothetical protein
MTYAWHDLVGNLGVMLIIGTYLGLQLERMSSTSLTYSALNGLGALLILVSLSQAFNLSSFVIEICWLAISGIGIAGALRKRSERSTSQG